MRHLFLFFLFILLLVTGMRGNGTTGEKIETTAHQYLSKNIVPHIVLKTVEEENQISYEWQIAPGGNLENITIKTPDAGTSKRNGHWAYCSPEAHQHRGEKRVAVEISIINNMPGIPRFRVGKYSGDKPLVIRLDLERCYAVEAAATTYYIRTDGGTADQCTGTTDAAYPGSGSNQPCAWSHPFWALDSGGNWRIQGGDTIIIASGSYMMGYGAPNTSGLCEASYAYECNLPPLPSGPDSANPTRILGKGWDSGCAAPPELWGTQRTWSIFDLTGSSNVHIGCLDITDHSGCIEFHADSSVTCERNTYPFGDWASDGIVASDSSSVTLKDLDIHGLAEVGIRAGRLTDWTIDNVRVAGNGWAGWDGDIDGNDSNGGTLTFDQLLVEWNGCGESYPGKEPLNCWAQTAGGYGDGLGTGATGGHWIFRDCIFRYNTSDGLDLLYARVDGSQIDIQRMQSYGNAGNQLKLNGNAQVENSLLVGNCGYFDGKSFTYNV
ncbi:MAG: hypothetical protein GY765_21810, partial [bacterium]|nr:hypothetical protein [bacterium]